MSRRASAVAALVLTGLALTIVGCDSPVASQAEIKASPDAPDVVIGGAGSTFVGPLMTEWIKGYKESRPKTLVTYLTIGSGAGPGLRP
jgi:ABC-type phosphate transport system substrate-binding protein